MTDLATPSALPTNGHGTARPVTRRRGLPGGRAVIGGFLVAASAAGVFASWQASTGTPSTRFVVVRDDVSLGDTIDAGDLATVAIELPDAQRRVAFTDVDALIGATALSPLAAGQLVQTTDVAKPVGAPERAQISLRLEPGDAVGGELRAGDTVDVIVTYTSGGEPETATIAAGALVVKLVEDRDRVGAGGSIVVVLAVRPQELEPIATAAAAGHVTVARTTGVRR